MSESSINNLAQTDTSFDAYISDVLAEDTYTGGTIQLRIPQRDGNGKCRIKGLAEYLSRLVIDYAIPNQEIKEAILKGETEGNSVSSEMVRLQKKALGTFTSIKSSGEGGEVLLFWIINNVFGFPQILSKMSLKTSSEMHYHGVDGVHLHHNPIDNSLELFWGESKLKGKHDGAIRDAFSSLCPILNDLEGTRSAGQRDFHLLTDNLDIEDPVICEFVKKFLDRDSEEFLKLRTGGIFLVGFDDSRLDSADEFESDPEIVDGILKKCKKLVQKRVDEHKIEHLPSHVVCVAFPSASEFKKAFVKELGI